MTCVIIACTLRLLLRKEPYTVLMLWEIGARRVVYLRDNEAPYGSMCSSCS